MAKSCFTLSLSNATIINAASIPSTKNFFIGFEKKSHDKYSSCEGLAFVLSRGGANALKPELYIKGLSIRKIQKRRFPTSSLNMLYLCMIQLLMGVAGIASAARILLVPPQIGSHILEQIIIGEELAQRGHQVFIAMGTPYLNKANTEAKGIKILQYKIPTTEIYGFSSDMDKFFMETIIFGAEKDKMAVSYKVASQLSYRDCAYMMNDKEFLEAAKKASPELAIVEAFLPSPCFFILPKFLAIPYVSTSLLYMPWEHRFPALPSFSPLFLTWTDSADITFLSRLQNLLIFLRSESILAAMAPRNNSLLEKFAPGTKHWNELLHRSELFLVGTDHHLGNTVPQMPNYISMAGISAGKAKKLPPDLDELMRHAKGGVILMSCGSICRYFPEDVIVKYLEAFGKLNQTILAKIHIPDGYVIPENVHPLSWLPQNDLLGHPNMKLFITHCGNGGQHEALYHGVPIVGIPLFAEQHLNCIRCHKKGFGLCMDVHDFTSDQLLSNIQEVMTNPKYRSAIQKASEIFRNQPMHPLNRTIFWIEHVMKYGGKHLRSFAMDMPLYEFLMLDVLGILLITFSVAALVLILLLRFVRNRCLRLSESIDPKLKQG